MARAGALTLALALAACAPAAPVGSPCRTMLIVRTSDALRSREDVARLVEAAAAAGVDRLAIAAKMDEEGDWLEPPIVSGEAFYASAIAPRAGGYEELDVLEVALELAHARGIEVLAWLPQFHDVAAARAHPDWRMIERRDGELVAHEVFLDPGDADARAYQRSIAVEVAERYAVDGIVIDWVRYDGWAMDLSEGSRARYLDETGVDPISIDFATDGEARRAWGEHRAEIVASHVREIATAIRAARPGIEVGVFVLPPGFVEVSQDVARFADAVDFVSPMLYFDDWSYPSSWVYDEALPVVRERASGRTRIVPALDEDWSDEEYRDVMLGIRRTAPELEEIAWFAFEAWPAELVERLTAAQGCE